MAVKPPDLKNRSPKVEILPDLRQRIARVYELINEAPKQPTHTSSQPGLADYLLAWGTPDATYPNLRLIKQDVSGQAEENGNNPAQPCAKPPQLTRVYETISATGETAVGNTDITIDQDDLTECENNFLQFSGQTPTFQTPGTSSITAPNGVTCYLKNEVRTDDGTLQRIKRTYISKGLISQTDETKFDGGLLIRSLTYVNQVPPTPSGYTLVTAKVDHPNGNALYTYTFAKGGGQISQNVEYRLSPDQGTTGVTVYTIVWLTVPGASNPITPPGGSQEITIKWDDNDGYMTWTGTYASGQGTIAVNKEIREGGLLIITTITAINAAPSAPAASIGGTPTLIKSDVRNGTRFEDGTVIYDYAWAEGQGQISVSVSYENSVNQGTAGTTKTTIKFLTYPGITSNPITAPGGSVLAVIDWAMDSGYKVWTGVYVSGTGTISSDVETKEYGSLKIYRISALNTAPTAPSPTIGGTVNLIDAETRVENGQTLYTYRWAEGFGYTLLEVNTIEAGALVVYHSIRLGAAPAAPSATIGGTVTLFETETRNADGYQINDYRWVEANGQSSITKRGEPDGALLYEVVTKTGTASTPAYPGSGTAYLIDLQNNQGDGYMTNRATYKKPPGTLALNRSLKFKFPGTVSILSSPSGVQLNPPVDMDILAVETITYGTTQVSTVPWTLKGCPSYSAVTTPTNQNAPKQQFPSQEAWGGYVAAATGASGTASTFNGVACDSWAYTISASNPTSGPSGATTLEVHNDPYLTDVTGVVVYRSRVTSYSF